MLRVVIGIESVNSILYTATDPMFIVIVVSTYPELGMLYYKMTKNSFQIFVDRMVREEPGSLPNWAIEGF